MNKFAALFMLFVLGLGLFNTISCVNAYERWSELTREEQIERAGIYTTVALYSGREVVVHPDYGFEIPLSLALMSD